MCGIPFGPTVGVGGRGTVTVQITSKVTATPKVIVSAKVKATSIFSLSIEESGLGQQIQASETRSYNRCPRYNPNIVYWKWVDDLLHEQDSVLK